MEQITRGITDRRDHKIDNTRYGVQYTCYILSQCGALHQNVSIQTTIQYRCSDNISIMRIYSTVDNIQKSLKDTYVQWRPLTRFMTLDCKKWTTVNNSNPSYRFRSWYAQCHGSGFKSHHEQQRLTSFSLESFPTFKFVRLLLNFLGVCDTCIKQQPVSSTHSQHPPKFPNISQQLATDPNRLYSLYLLHFNQCLIMLFKHGFLLSNTSCGYGYCEPPISSTI